MPATKPLYLLGKTGDGKSVKKGAGAEGLPYVGRWDCPVGKQNRRRRNPSQKSPKKGRLSRAPHREGDRIVTRSQDRSSTTGEPAGVQEFTEDRNGPRFVKIMGEKERPDLHNQPLSPSKTFHRSDCWNQCAKPEKDQGKTGGTVS